MRTSTLVRSAQRKAHEVGAVTGGVGQLRRGERDLVARSYRELLEAFLDGRLTTSGPEGVDFSVGVPDGRLFPIETWRRLIGQTLRTNDREPARARLGYGAVQADRIDEGLARLRNEFAR
jgi:DNA-binding transcriptional MocR family regulator